MVIFNTDTSLKKLDPERDMLCNITVDNKPIATARFMGGRDFDLISHSFRSPINRESIDHILGSDIFALPSFTSGGPFPKKVGEVIGKNISKRESLAALATIYLVCMTKEILDLLDSKNTIIIDGGFANNMYYMELLKELCSTQKIYCNKRAEGTSLGAATIAFENINGCRFDNPCKEIIGKTSNKMKQYYTKWKSLVS